MKKIIKSIAFAGVAIVALTGCTEKDISNLFDIAGSVIEIFEENKVDEPVVVTSDLPVAEQLAELVISEPQQNMHLYSGRRDELFPHWKEVDTKWGWDESDLGTSCNTRWYSLYRDSLSLEWYDQSNCILGESTQWVDPYGVYSEDGSVYYHNSGDPSEFDIDHIVSLADAWRTGAEAMTLDERTSLANDPMNLITTHYSSNRAKSDSTPEMFLSDSGNWYYIPTESPIRCEIATRYIQVKHKYGLTITQGDFNALGNVLNNECE